MQKIPEIFSSSDARSGSILSDIILQVQKQAGCAALAKNNNLKTSFFEGIFLEQKKTSGKFSFPMFPGIDGRATRSGACTS
jgi:hypothetical protein